MNNELKNNIKRKIMSIIITSFIVFMIAIFILPIGWCRWFGLIGIWLLYHIVDDFFKEVIIKHLKQ